MNRTIVVYNESYAELPENPVEFMDFWQSKLDLIPSEFYDSAKIEVEAEEHCDLIVRIIYKRPETPEELEEGNLRRDRTLATRRAAELQTLKELKAKYE